MGLRGAYGVGIVCATLALIAGCTTTTRIDRADWGAISPDATVRVVTVDGTMRTVTRIVAFTDALEAFDEQVAAPVTIPLDSIEYIESRSGPSVWPVLVAIAAGVTAIAIISARGASGLRPEPTPTSCPFLYSFDGEEYVFDSETYAGAITRGLERTDLDNLDHLVAVDGAYRLLLTNERPETEYTDELSLVVVDHPEGTAVHPDSRGDPRVIVGARPATSAMGLRGGDYTAELAARDGHIWTGDPLATADLSVDSELRDGVILDFPRPDGPRALLAVDARNTELAPLALQIYLELQGDDLLRWYHRVDHDPDVQAMLREWVSREGTLHVSVWADGEWRLQDRLIDVGPLLAKTQVAVLDLSGVVGDRVRVKLESARGLWTLDWAALGAESDVEVSSAELVPSLAVDARGRDLTPILAEADGTYYTALEGDSVQLEFRAPSPPQEGSRRTVLARSTGFYHVHTNHEGPAQTELAERILVEPLFGNRYMIGLLRSAAAFGLGR